MKFKFLLIFVLLFLSSYDLAQEPRIQQYNTQAIVYLPRMMKTAGFWISRHPSPDAVIMGPDAVDQFNARLRNDKKLTKDIFTFVQDLKVEALLKSLEKTFSDITAKDYYTAAGVREDKKFMDNVKRNMNLSGVGIGVAPHYGLVVHYASQRFLPTNEELDDEYKRDQLQNRTLDAGTPVAVVHASADGLWYYVMTAASDGWVEAKDIALGDANQVREFAEDKNFAVVIRPKADIFMNETMTDYYDYAHMGLRLPLAGIGAGRVMVKVPVMGSDGNLAVKEAYMNAEDVNPGFLPFTARNIYKQALMMLNQPYGWGGIYGEQDCSLFLQMVFATMGIILPGLRDQEQVSNRAVDFDEKSDDITKIAAIAKAPAPNTLLAMDWHIMLYLGTVNGKPYAIHNTPFFNIGHVFISDMFSGLWPSKGTYLRRLKRIVTIE